MKYEPENLIESAAETEQWSAHDVGHAKLILDWFDRIDVERATLVDGSPPALMLELRNSGSFFSHPDENKTPSKPILGALTNLGYQLTQAYPQPVKGLNLYLDNPAALHEAAHIVVATRLRVEIKGASISPEGRGETLIGTSENPAALVTIYLAGITAEGMTHCLPTEIDDSITELFSDLPTDELEAEGTGAIEDRIEPSTHGDPGDWTNALSLVLYTLETKPEDVETTLRAGADRATKILRRNWNAVDALTQKLAETNKLTPAEISETLST